MSTDEREEAVERLRDLTRRLGFGDNITEPQADNDTIVGWFEEQGRDASEWHEHERWRIDCHLAGHPDDEDCAGHGPTCCNRPHGDLRQHREDWASWLEGWIGAVGPEPPTPEAIVKWLRADHLPFGVAAPAAEETP